MDTTELLNVLEYRGSPNFLEVERLSTSLEHSHVFRRAVKACALHHGRLHGVYQLGRGTTSTTPVVYVVEAAGPAEADAIHRKVWNQNVVPFLLVKLPDSLRLYSGFAYAPRAGDAATEGAQAGVLAAAVAFDRVLVELGDLRAEAIDDGRIWRSLGRSVDPARRVDSRLLENLQQLGRWLRGRDLDASVAHALIGKFVYLRYLRERGILSDARLAEFGVDPREVFGRDVTVRAVRQVVERVEEWLNGSVFPIRFSGPRAPSAEHVREVARVFLGDEAGTGQLHLDFAAYDFSYIPVETLSIIYEQFLAAEGRQRAAGAYYTPLPLVSFVLDELQDVRPLGPGIRVFDPACGSGAFLVQCYRRLIEGRRRDTERLKPSELREILVRQVFGLDRDGDACGVTELSLVLTMLDYIEPPDLRTTPTFKLPELRGRNIVQGDFFDSSNEAARSLPERFEWIVGNPPWIALKSSSQQVIDGHVRGWLAQHAHDRPVVAQEVAEAFAWKALDHAARDAAIGLLLPAKSLFCEDGAFRGSFFSTVDVHSVANFSNLREVLFAGRARMPAAAVFYSARAPASDDDVLVFSPLVANQEANRPATPGTRRETWTVSINQSEVRSVPRRKLAEGAALPWKIAMWGTFRDERVLASASRRFATLGDLQNAGCVFISQGLELRDPTQTREPLEPLREVLGKLELDIELLKRTGRIHTLPRASLRRVGSERAFVRRGRATRPLRVCQPPHVIVSAARTFAVFSDEYVVVPPRQVGIASGSWSAERLRALALYLSSDFVAYHQFFESSQAGVRDGRNTLASLLRLPVPIAELDDATVRAWADLQRRLAELDRDWFDGGGVSAANRDELREASQEEIDALVSSALGLTASERWLIHDLVRVRMQLTDGRLPEGVLRPPARAELEAYATVLRQELDAFLDPALGREHRVVVVFQGDGAMVEVSLANRGRGRAVVATAEPALAARLSRVRREIDRREPQWLYFDRNLILHVDDGTYLVKPMQRMWWTRSQALADADELIAQALAPGDEAA